MSDYVSSEKIGMIHGDLHCGNMLVTGKRLSWVDPNGCFELPLEYDLGKLLHSVHGNYGSIIRGKYLISHISLKDYHFSYFEPKVYKNAQKIKKEAANAASAKPSRRRGWLKLCWCPIRPRARNGCGVGHVWW